MNANRQTCCVDPALIERIWPKASPVILHSLSHHGDEAPARLEYIRQGLNNRTMLLWITFVGDEIDGVVVTSVTLEYGRKRLLIVTLGGRNMRQWIKHMPLVEKYAKDEGCESMRFDTRRERAWLRVMAGWREAFITLEKRI